jgi:hypothetical protein
LRIHFRDWRGAKRKIVTVCFSGGPTAADLFEIH